MGKSKINDQLTDLTSKTAWPDLVIVDIPEEKPGKFNIIKPHTRYIVYDRGF